MITFFILCLIYFLLIPIAHLLHERWLEKERKQKDVPHRIYNAINHYWGIDYEEFWSAMKDLKNAGIIRYRYYNMYGRDIMNELMDELPVTQFEQSLAILKTKNNETIPNFIKNNF